MVHAPPAAGAEPASRNHPPTRTLAGHDVEPDIAADTHSSISAIPSGQQVSPINTKAVPAATGPHHAHHSSLSPRGFTALSDPDYYPDRDGEDDVFSNPDTAELDARSDATGATSPDRATSPALSPDPRAIPSAHHLASAAAGLDCEDDLALLDDPKKSNSIHQGQVLQHQPSLTSQLTQDTAMPVVSSDSASTPTPSVFRHGPRLPTTAAEGWATSMSRSDSRRRSSAFPILLPDNQHPLPAANDLPSDPSEASHVSTLFAHPPAPPSDIPTAHGSPATSAIRLALSQSPVTSASPSAAGSPVSERRNFSWTIPSTSMQRSGSRGVTRPSSPERQKTIMPNLSGTLRTDLQPQHSSQQRSAVSSYQPSPVLGGSPQQNTRALAPSSFGLGLSSPAPSSVAASPASNAAQGRSLAHADASTASQVHPTPLLANEASIFERDIEHRDARHVLSKSEAVDVAIPPVLDDAVEAIIEGGEEPLEIVAPLASATPAALPLSALALSASASSLASEQLSSSSGPQSSPSPPMSNSGGFILATKSIDDPPPGSIAAQIAERLLPSASTRTTASSVVQDDSSVVPGSSPTRTGTLRNAATAHSSGASSVCSSQRSRSPGRTATMGVQQVLDGSVVGQAATEPSSPSHTSAARALRGTSPSSVAGGTTTPVTPARNTATTSSVLSSAQGKALAASSATALPALGLPNPFRSETPSLLKTHSPSVSFSRRSFDAASAPLAPMSMSLDGAVIPSADAAIREMSLDSMADAIVEAEAGQNMPSPILPRKGFSSPAPPSIASFGRRDTAATITPATSKATPLPSSAFAVQDDAEHTSPATRRLSFFSYANIINDTPAEVVGLEESVQRTLEDSSKSASVVIPTTLASPQQQ